MLDFAEPGDFTVMAGCFALGTIPSTFAVVDVTRAQLTVPSFQVLYGEALEPANLATAYVSMSVEEEGSIIWFTTDGTSPLDKNGSRAQFKAHPTSLKMKICLPETTVVFRAAAFKVGLVPSKEVCEELVVRRLPLPAATRNFLEGTVTLESTVPKCQFYYTNNGQRPEIPNPWDPEAKTSKMYNAGDGHKPVIPAHKAATVTYKVKACCEGYVPSTMAVFECVVEETDAPAIAVDDSACQLGGPVQFAATSQSPNVSFYYSLDPMVKPRVGFHPYRPITHQIAIPGNKTEQTVFVAVIAMSQGCAIPAMTRVSCVPHILMLISFHIHDSIGSRVSSELFVFLGLEGRSRPLTLFGFENTGTRHPG